MKRFMLDATVVFVLLSLSAVGLSAGGGSTGGSGSASAANGVASPAVTRMRMVSLTLTSVSLVDALLKLFENSDQSYVLDTKVPAGVQLTLSLHAVSLETALATICDAAGLQCTQRNGVWFISPRTDMATIGGVRLPVVGAMGVSRPMLPGELPGNFQLPTVESPELSSFLGASKHPSFKGEDNLIDLDVKDMPLSEVATKLSHKVPPPAQGEVPEGDPFGEASRGAFDSLEIIVPEAVRNLNVTAKIVRWPLGKVLDMLTDQTNLVCSKEEVISEPIHTKEGHAAFHVKTTRVYLVPRPELSVSGVARPYEGRIRRQPAP